jgi:hypothetical protein
MSARPLRTGLVASVMGARSGRPVLLVYALGVLTLGALLAAGSTNADVFGPIELESQGAVQSAGEPQQADYAHHPAISGDGRYVVFDGSFGGVSGVWRRDLTSGAIEQVAPGDAQLPSISAEGRYVSFTTNEQLVPGDRNEGPDVYVRDMDVHSSSPCTQESASEGTCPFELVSAVNGAPEEALTYQSSSPKHYGSLAAGRSAISADGRYVAFVTTAESNLDGPMTPAMQVAVRDRSEKHTELVSALIDPATGRPQVTTVEGVEQDEPVPDGVEGSETFGAVYPGGLAISSFPQPSGVGTVGASISADGSTVAWIGQQIDRQAPVLPGEFSMEARYTEPLWRRIHDGPASPIRRITGGSDPTNPACAASGEIALEATPTLLDPCQGPFAIEGEAFNGGLWTLPWNTADALPKLSADGEKVAILVNAREVASGQEFGSTNNFSDDLYVVEMQEGLSRVQALHRLTEVAGAKEIEQARTAPIVDFDISPDGSQVAFTALRTVFPLGSPAYISAPATFPGMVELYEADLADQTLTRVSHGFEGEDLPSEAPHLEAEPGVDPYLESEGSFSPSFSDDGADLAFSSTASNLVYGDGNTPSVNAKIEPFDGSDVFVVTRSLFTGGSAEAQVSSPPAGPALDPEWKLAVSARSRRDGSVMLEALVPGQGELRAGAKSSIVVKRSSGAHGKVTSTHHARRAGIVARTVASRTAHPGSAGLVTVTLTLAKPYAALASVRGGLSAMVELLFSAPGHQTLAQGVPVTFLRTPTAHRSPHSGRAHSAHRKGHRR